MTRPHLFARRAGVAALMTTLVVGFAFAQNPQPSSPQPAAPQAGAASARPLSADLPVPPPPAINAKAEAVFDVKATAA